ncbi:hypothetical protein KHQ81_00810 [Mycoplasmatota bacterium]|nr:hypothetical protein KHQ81_00810 [Mycoplasmatota bacterium]
MTYLNRNNDHIYSIPYPIQPRFYMPYEIDWRYFDPYYSNPEVIKQMIESMEKDIKVDTDDILDEKEKEIRTLTTAIYDLNNKVKTYVLDGKTKEEIKEEVGLTNEFVQEALKLELQAKDLNIYVNLLADVFGIIVTVFSKFLPKLFDYFNFITSKAATLSTDNILDSATVLRELAEDKARRAYIKMKLLGKDEECKKKLEEKDKKIDELKEKIKELEEKLKKKLK